MNHLVKLSLQTLAASLIAAGMPGAALAQQYPNKIIKLVVPVAPGGPSDTVARVVAQKLSEQLGQQVIVDNKVGGGANIGAEFVAKAAPDGYTLLLGSTTQAINKTLYKKLNYDIVTDLAPVTRLTSGPLVLVVNPALPVNSVQDLIALSKKKPLNFASSNVGASTHLAGEMLNARASLKNLHVPYKGSGPALTDTMGGQVDYMFDTMLSAMPFVKSGKLKALAVTSLQRAPMAPELPTMNEAGLKGFEAIAWNGIFAPPKTPDAILVKLNTELRKVLDNAEVKEKFAAQGFAVSGQTQKEFGAFVLAETQKWGELIKASGATAE